MAVPIRKMPADWEPEPAPSADPFRYGWRPKLVHLPGGDFFEQRIALTPEDLLDPQLGDFVTQRGVHFKLVRDLSDLLDRHFATRDDVYIGEDLKMLWGIPGLREPAPDIAVIFGVAKDPDRSSFDVVKEGARPSLVIEVVSSTDSETRANDYERKVEIYQRAGIPEYVILDPPHPVTQGRLLLAGYRLAADGRYRRIEPDAQGRLLCLTTQLFFGVDEDGSSLVVINALTGERLRTSPQLEAALEAQTEARRAADERASRETEARRAADERAFREAEARWAADERASREAEARQASEERASREAEARRAAEAELVRLRDELDRVRKTGR